MPAVFATLQKERRAAVITFRGFPQFLLVPIDPDQMPSLAWSANPDLFEDDMRAADEGLVEELEAEDTPASDVPVLSNTELPRVRL